LTHWLSPFISVWVICLFLF